MGPFAARRVDDRLTKLHASGAPGGDHRDVGAWRDVADIEPGTADQLVTVGALCTASDLDVEARALRGALAPGGRLLFLEHVGRTGVFGLLHRGSDRVYAVAPMGCHVDRDVPAALRRAGLLITDLERCTMPSAIPLLRPWVQGTAVVAGGRP